MGNKLVRRRQVVDDKYTRPQGLYQHKNVDHKKLRKLILESKLAPCYPGGEDGSADMEECPICFLFYPSLNRSRCCTKGICTECFLQMKPPHSSRPTQCPFCKTPNFAVEYRGKRTKEEKNMEQAEEQKVIEAKLRMRQRELQDDKERMLNRNDTNTCCTRMTLEEAEYRNAPNGLVPVPSVSFPGQNEETVHPLNFSFTPSVIPPHSMLHREANFDLDIEDIMLMEAIWLSIQETQPQRNATLGDTTLLELSAAPESHPLLPAMNASESLPPSGLACAIAALDEHQQMNGLGNGPPVYRFEATPNASSLMDMRRVVNYPSENWIEVSPNSGRAVVARQESNWMTDHGSALAEVGCRFAGSDAMLEGGGSSLPTNDSMGNQFQPQMARPIFSGNFEEQMMLAMTVPLAEARGRASPLGMAWL